MSGTDYKHARTITKFIVLPRRRVQREIFLLVSTTYRFSLTQTQTTTPRTGAWGNFSWTILRFWPQRIIRRSMANHIDTDTGPFSQLTTELVQMIWLYCDFSEQSNFRLVNRSFEEKVQQLYVKKWFTRRTHLCTKHSLQALLGIASTEHLARNVQHLELVVVDFIFAKGGSNMRPRSRVPEYLLQSTSESSSAHPRYLPQAERTRSWKSENTWLWEEKNLTTLLEQIFDRFSEQKLNSIAITSNLGQVKPYGALALQKLAILTPKDGQADLDKEKTFLPVLKALMASKSPVNAARLDEVRCLGTFIDAWAHVQDLWTNIRSLDVCLFEIFKYQNSERRKALPSFISSCARLEDLKLGFESDYDLRDHGDCFSEIVRSLREAPLRRFTVTSMAVRKVDLDRLLQMSSIQSVWLYDIHCNSSLRHDAAFANLDEYHWSKDQV